MGIEFIECYTPPEDVVTCSVKLDFSELADYSYDGVIFHIAYTELGNNGIRFADRTRFDNFQTEMTLENVVMGSVMYLSSKIPIAPRYDVDTSDFTPIWYERGVFCLVPEAEDLTIQFYYDVNEAVDARPDQVEEGVKFVGANGVVEDGKLPFYDGTDMNAAVYDSNDEYAHIQSWVDKKSIIEDVVYSKVPLSQFGNAEAEYVVEGQTFTSATGYKSTGILPIQEGFLTPDEMQDYDGDDNLYVSCPIGRSLVESGVTVKIPLSNFGNATAADVRKGKRFTSAEGFEKDGEMPMYDGEHLIAQRNENVDSDTGFGFYVYPGYNDYFVQDEVYLEVPKSALGNASPMSVRSNVTFTSEDGVKIQGALENLSEDDLNRARFDDEDTDDADDFKFWAEAKQRGVVESGISFKVPKTNFGFVTPDLVPEGYTFTSMYGFNTGGTMPSKGDDDLTVDGNKVTVPAGYYPYGAQKTAGVTIDTCTVNVTFSKNAGITLISATTFENGTISVVNQRVSDKNSGQSFSIPNVVCGSALSINTEYIVSFYGSFDKYYHGFSLGGTITVPSAPGTYTVEVGELDD